MEMCVVSGMPCLDPFENVKGLNPHVLLIMKCDPGVSPCLSGY